MYILFATISCKKIMTKITLFHFFQTSFSWYEEDKHQGASFYNSKTSKPNIAFSTQSVPLRQT